MSQMDFPFPCDDAKLKAFLTQWLIIEWEEDRLREEKRLLKEDYGDHIPLRGVMTAVKVVRAKEKLEQHPKESVSYVHQRVMEHIVEEHLNELRKNADMVQELLRPMKDRGVSFEMLAKETIQAAREIT